MRYWGRGSGHTVNDAIGDLDDTNLTADSNKGAFGLIQVMQDDIEQAARTGAM